MLKWGSTAYKKPIGEPSNRGIPHPHCLKVHFIKFNYNAKSLTIISKSAKLLLLQLLYI